MIAARYAMLAVTAALTLAVMGGIATDLQPSARRVMVAAVIGLIAPLFWPGRASTPALTVLRIAVWSGAAAGMAAVALLAAGGPGQPLGRILPVCAMLILILFLTHAATAQLEGFLQLRSGDAEGSREVAVLSVSTLLALLGSMPIWLGPTAELVAGRHAWIVDAVIGASPLTHLAVASGNDLLRNQWFYQHSNLAALPFSYPGLVELMLSYVVLCLAPATMPLVTRFLQRTIAGPTPSHSTTEHAK